MHEIIKDPKNKVIKKVKQYDDPDQSLLGEFWIKYTRDQKAPKSNDKTNIYNRYSLYGFIINLLVMEFLY
jgi:hypothetical protein